MNWQIMLQRTMDEKEIDDLLESLDDVHIYDPQLVALSMDEYDEYLQKILEESADDSLITLNSATYEV